MFRKQDDAKPVAVPEHEPTAPLASERPAAAPEPRPELTRIGPSLAVKGDLSGQEDLFFDGTMEGRIHLPDSRVVVGPNGRVQADMEASEIVVEGSVTGNLHGRVRVELRRTSRVCGEVTTGRIAIQEGARFKGRIEVVRGEEARAARAASASAAAESYPAVAASPAGETKESLR